MTMRWGLKGTLAALALTSLVGWLVRLGRHPRAVAAERDGLSAARRDGLFGKGLHDVATSAVPAGGLFGCRPGLNERVPSEFREALTVSEFVKDPTHLVQAVRAADELWKVELGQLPLYVTLEGIRARSEDAYSHIMHSLIPYVEAVTGKRLVDRVPAVAGFAAWSNDRVDLSKVPSLGALTEGIGKPHVSHPGLAGLLKKVEKGKG